MLFRIPDAMGNFFLGRVTPYCFGATTLAEPTFTALAGLNLDGSACDDSIAKLCQSSSIPFVIPSNVLDIFSEASGKYFLNPDFISPNSPAGCFIVAPGPPILLECAGGLFVSIPDAIT